MTYQLGVDLGTTFTSAAVARDGRVAITALGAREPAMPSILYIGADGDVLIGEPARQRGLTEPRRMAREVKRHIGDSVPLVLGGVPYAAEDLTAKLLGAVVDVVAAAEGEPAGGMVITHPAAWGAYKQDLLTRAARLAGVEATTISEPEAVATYYASVNRVEPGQTLAVYSLGGGQFEAAVLRKAQKGFEMLGRPEGIDRAGDIDDVVFAYVLRQVGGLVDIDTTDESTESAVALLREACIAAKEELSLEPEVSIPVLLPNIQTEVRLARAEFEAMVRPLLEETAAALGRVLRSAAVAPTDLSAALLVGGSTRIPLVGELVSGALGRPVTVVERHAVALGAALVADERSHGVVVPGAGPVVARSAEGVASAPQLPLDDDVQFTVYRPSRVQPDRWYQLLAFAHRTTLIEEVDGRVVDPVEVVERQARALLEDKRASFGSIRADASSALLRGSELRFQPWLEEGEVNPASAAFRWLEPVHRAEFRIRLPASAEGRSIRGVVRVSVGVVIVGEVPFRLQVTSLAPATLRPEVRSAARRYRQIFASYSRRDAAVVEAVARYVGVTGDRYLIDVQNLRSGERWEPALERFIEQADIFQLFWSQNSMRSPFVRQEWEYALALGRDEFVRPVYWDDQLPEDQTLGLPPDALRALHFSKLALDVTPPPVAEGSSGGPWAAQPASPEAPSALPAGFPRETKRSRRGPILITIVVALVIIALVVTLLR